VHAEAIRRAADARIAGGYPDGSFGPAAAVERGQMASFLTRARGLVPTGDTDFPDILDGDRIRAHLAEVAAALRRASAAQADPGRRQPSPPGTVSLRAGSTTMPGPSRRRLFASTRPSS